MWTMWHVTGQTPVIWVLFFSSHGVVLVFEGVIAGEHAQHAYPHVMACEGGTAGQHDCRTHAHITAR